MLIDSDELMVCAYSVSIVLGLPGRNEDMSNDKTPLLVFAGAFVSGETNGSLGGGCAVGSAVGTALGLEVGTAGDWLGGSEVCPPVGIAVGSVMTPSLV